jgi:hypothetical protein
MEDSLNRFQRAVIIAYGKNAERNCYVASSGKTEVSSYGVNGGSMADSKYCLFSVNECLLL